MGRNTDLDRLDIRRSAKQYQPRSLGPCNFSRLSVSQMYVFNLSSVPVPAVSLWDALSTPSALELARERAWTSMSICQWATTKAPLVAQGWGQAGEWSPSLSLSLSLSGVAGTNPKGQGGGFHGAGRGMAWCRGDGTYLFGHPPIQQPSPSCFPRVRRWRSKRPIHLML